MFIRVSPCLGQRRSFSFRANANRSVQFHNQRKSSTSGCRRYVKTRGYRIRTCPPQERTGEINELIVKFLLTFYMRVK